MNDVAEPRTKMGPKLIFLMSLYFWFFQHYSTWLRVVLSW